MRELVNVISYDDYIDSILNEDLVHGEQDKCNNAFAHGGPITFPNGDVVKPREILYAVEQAYTELKTNYTRTFRFAERTLNVIYLRQSNKIKTMAVDKHLNLYMNAWFIYDTLKMDPKLIAAVIMHEVFHVMFNHIERGTNWLAAKGKPRNAQTWHDTNLAADIEVNQALVRCGLADEDVIINQIHGLYLRNAGSFCGRNTNVVPMEIILDNEDYMKKLREMCPPDPAGPDKKDQPKNKIKTTPEWDQGYKDAWNKVASIIKKYGPQEAYKKFVEAGIVNELGEVILKERTVDNIMAVEFKQVKTMDEYVEELNETNTQEVGNGQTYEEGFAKGFEKLMGKLYQSIQPDDDEEGGEEGGQGGGGEEYESGVNDEDLDEVNLPQKGKKANSNDQDGLPENINSDESEGEDEQNGEENEDDKEGQGKQGKRQKSGQKSHKGGKGGQRTEDEDITADDINTLAKDLKDRTQGGNKTISTEQEITIGGTGSFQDEGLSDEDLKEAGYEGADLESINKVRKKNETNNSKAKIAKEVDRARREMDSTDFVRKYLDAIEVESKKYRNIWKQILEEFMAKKTRRAGKDLPDGHNDWANKKAISRGEYGIHRRMTSQDPQDVNVYVDVSGSMDIKLLEIICKSLVIFTQEWEYSGLNICPWASYSGGVHKIKDFYDKSEAEITNEILEIISTGANSLGGGTAGNAALGSILDAVKETLGDENKEAKDDIHVIITDGGFDYQGFEQRMSSALMQEFHRSDVADNAPGHTFWMIYDADQYLRNDLEKEIKKGKLVFIVSEVVKNNA